MNIERYTTRDGFPGVRWDQEVPTGQTVYSRCLQLQWKLAVVCAVAVWALLLVVGRGGGEGFFCGLLVAAMLGAPEAVRAIFKADDQGVRVDTEKGEKEREVEARARATHLYRWEKRSAEVMLGPDTEGLIFVIRHGVRAAEQMVQRLPLESFDELELGTEEEWFGDAADRELAELHHRPSVLVIVAPAGDHGIVPIARSVRDKAGMAKLHQVLQLEFIGKRRALLARHNELKARV